jgi:hypothetical protein
MEIFKGMASSEGHFPQTVAPSTRSLGILKEIETFVSSLQEARGEVLLEHAFDAMAIKEWLLTFSSGLVFRIRLRYTIRSK